MFLEFFMEHRDIECAVLQGSNRDTWRWMVDLEEKTAGAGQRKTREAAPIPVDLTIDRWLARQAEFRPQAMRRLVEQAKKQCHR
jgi:hypothetical protein